MTHLLITNHAAMSEAQHRLALVVWHFAGTIRDVRNRTDDEFDAIIHELSTAICEIWSNYSDLNDRIMICDVNMYMRPTITSDNFNFIAWNALEQLKLLVIKYKMSFRRNYATSLSYIDGELEQLHAWNTRLIAKVKEVTKNTRDMLTVLPEDVLENVVKKIAISDTPL